jgi:hypothetical protein
VVATTPAVYSIGWGESFRVTGTRFDSPAQEVPRLLDPALLRVARHRQVSIKTARDWRDSDNRKWHDALCEIGYLPAIEVPAAPLPSHGFFDASIPAETATTAKTATDPSLDDPFEEVELEDPFEGVDLADLP